MTTGQIKSAVRRSIRAPIPHGGLGMAGLSTGLGLVIEPFTVTIPPTSGGPYLIPAVLLRHARPTSQDRSRCSAKSSASRTYWGQTLCNRERHPGWAYLPKAIRLDCV